MPPPELICDIISSQTWYFSVRRDNFVFLSFCIIEGVKKKEKKYSNFSFMLIIYWYFVSFFPSLELSSFPLSNSWSFNKWSMRHRPYCSLEDSKTKSTNETHLFNRQPTRPKRFHTKEHELRCLTFFYRKNFDETSSLWTIEKLKRIFLIDSLHSLNSLKTFCTSSTFYEEKKFHCNCCTVQFTFFFPEKKMCLLNSTGFS